jgi:hypothetical protein
MKKKKNVGQLWKEKDRQRKQITLEARLCRLERLDEHKSGAGESRTKAKRLSERFLSQRPERQLEFVFILASVVHHIESHKQHDDDNNSNVNKHTRK